MEPVLNPIDKGDVIEVEKSLKPENEVDYIYVTGSQKEKALVRKIDIHMLPILWLMYVFNYIDRSNIGNAKVGGLQADLHLSSADYSLALSIFFLSYLLFEIPSNMILARTKPSRYLPAIMFVWGAISIAAKGITSLGGLVALRLAVGAVEAGFFPGVVLLLSCWYKPFELSKRLALFYSASLISGAFSGLLAGGIIDGLEGVGGTRGWKWLFIIEGLATAVVAFAAFFILPDYPLTTSWLSPEEKKLAHARLIESTGAGDGEQIPHLRALKLALKDPKTWTSMLALNIYASTGTISYFFPTLVTTLGYSGRKAQFMTVPIYTVAFVLSLILGYSADRNGKKAYHCLGGALLGAVAFIIVVTVHNPKVKYAFISFGATGIWAGLPIFWSWMVTLFEGREKRAIAIAVINGVGNLASIYGSFFWPSEDAPRYVMGFSITIALLAAQFVVIAFNKWKFGERKFGAEQ